MKEFSLKCVLASGDSCHCDADTGGAADPGVVAGFGSGWSGWIRSRVKWLDPDLGVVVGSGCCG